MRLNPITPPAVEPVTIDEVQSFLRIDGDSEDGMLSSLITVARDWAERSSGRSFITQDWEMILDSSANQLFGTFAETREAGDDH